MASVRITGFRTGLSKIALTKMIRLHSTMDLAAAKLCTDTLLEGKSVAISVASEGEAKRLADELLKLGTMVEVRD
jgi:hypothetical protein